MNTPFQLFTVEPTYGAFRAVINVRLAAGLAGDVYIYRALDGATEWKLLNPGAPLVLTAGGFISFGDEDLIADFSIRPYYRGVLDPNGGDPSTWLAGPPVAPFEFINRRQQTRIQAIVKREYRAMSGRKGDGLQVVHLIPLEDGETVSRYDAETDQLLGPSCRNDPSDEGFGTRFVGGYYPPLQTWAKMTEASPEVDQPEQGGMTRQIQKADVGFRLLAHPRPAVGHLICLTRSDRRYVLNSPIKPYYFPGTDVVIAWEAGASLIENDDPRARLTIPNAIADPGTGG